jgi:hypothetical protein
LGEQELLLLCHLLITQMILKAGMLLVLVFLVINDLDLVAFASKNVVSLLLCFMLSLSLEFQFVEPLLLNDVNVVIQVLGDEYLRQVAD